MRLNLSQIEAIVKIKNKIFNESSKIYLFGSRLDDKKKGGDIDLYIKLINEETSLDKKLSFITMLENFIGEQKIDLIISKDTDRLIEKEAIQKGIELNLNKIKLDKYFNECDKHIQRIEEAYSDVKDIIPISASKYQKLNKEEVQGIDQYLFRFSKLQDTMGERIFKLILEEYNPSNEPITFIDLLNQLEKLGFIENTNEWLNLRKIRNEISHQYDDEPEEMSQAINSILNQKNIIKDIFLNLKKQYQKSN